MYRLIFRNRWAALLFVAITLASTARLVGGGERSGTLDGVEDDLLRQRAMMQSSTDDLHRQPVLQANGDDGFTSEKDLIDPAMGAVPMAESQK